MRKMYYRILSYSADFTQRYECDTLKALYTTDVETELLKRGADCGYDEIIVESESLQELQQLFNEKYSLSKIDGNRKVEYTLEQVTTEVDEDGESYEVGWDVIDVSTLKFRIYDKDLKEYLDGIYNDYYTAADKAYKIDCQKDECCEGCTVEPL